MPTVPTPIAAVQGLWEPAGTYLNTASFGLPPRPAWDALQAALDDWRTGRTSWEQWGESTEAARGSFARLVGVAAVDGGRRRDGLGARRPRRLVAAGGIARPRAGRGVHLDALSVPRPGAPRSDGAHGASPPISPGRSTPRRTSSRSAPCRWRPARWPTSTAIAAAAKAHGALTLVDATQACGWLPLDGYGFDVDRRRGLQVAALAARHRVHGGRTGAARRDRPDRGRLVRRRGRARVVLRRAAAARDRRPPARHLTRLAQLGRRGTRARAARGDRRRARFTRTTSRWRTASGPGSGSSRATRRSCSSTCPRPRRASSGRGSGRPCAAAGCARRGTSTTPARTSTGRSRR